MDKIIETIMSSTNLMFACGLFFLGLCILFLPALPYLFKKFIGFFVDLERAERENHDTSFMIPKPYVNKRPATSTMLCTKCGSPYLAHNDGCSQCNSK